MTVLRSASATDVGRVRAVNEDLALESPTLFAVADGMGGHAGGEVAADIAIDTLRAGFARAPSSDGLVAAVQEANRSVWERGLGDQDLRGMGTTVTALALVATADGDILVLVNVGDSRAYLLHGGELVQVTTDHSVAEELVARGQLSEAEAQVHPQRHILTRALGVNPGVEVDVWRLTPEEGDRYLLCSDGLSNEVPADVIAGVLSSVREPQEAAEALVVLANESGGNDNITALVVDVLIGEPAAADATDAAAAGAADVGAADGIAAATGGPSAPAGADVAAGRSPMAPVAQAAPRPRRRAPRRITFRVLFFLLILAALVAAAWVAVLWYVHDSYYVALTRGQIVIYQGRPGGFLGFEPKIVTRTGVTTDEVEQTTRHALSAGVQEPSLSAARKYVANLVMAECTLENPPPSCATTATTTTTTTVPVAPTTVTGAASALRAGAGTGRRSPDAAAVTSEAA